MPKNSPKTAIIILVVCLAGLLLYNVTNAEQKTYEIYTTPEYKTDTARAIDAYERLMEKFMSINEKNLSALSLQIQLVNERLISLDTKLTELSARLSTIENALGIKPACPQPAEELPAPEKTAAPAHNPPPRESQTSP